MQYRKTSVSIGICGKDFKVERNYAKLSNKFRKIFGESTVEENILNCDKVENQSNLIIVPEGVLDYIKIQIGDLAIIGNLDDILYATSLASGLPIEKTQGEREVDYIRNLNGYDISIYTHNGGARELEVIRHYS